MNKVFWEDHDNQENEGFKISIPLVPVFLTFILIGGGGFFLKTTNLIKYFTKVDFETITGGDGIIFDDADTRPITDEDIESLKYCSDKSYEELLQYAINERYAIHNCSFKGNTFCSQPWYSPDPNVTVLNFDWSRFNEQERQNIKKLKDRMTYEGF